MGARVALVTEQRYVRPAQPDWYVQQILTEDSLLSAALATHGINSFRVDWADDSVRWETFDAVIFRTPWDYFNRFDQFKQWLHRCETGVQFMNPIGTVRWNMDKHYLKDLAQRGIAIPSTVFIDRGGPRTLADHMRANGWPRAVLKPTVSGAGRHTYLLDANVVSAHEHVFRSLIANEDMMMQEFLPSITDRGEVSLIVIGGRFTHAVIKTAKAGDFRVQDDFGGTTAPYTATADLIAFAERVTAVCHPLPAYARVDVMWDTTGRPVVSELELIEPELWFRHCPGAATALGMVIAAQINS